MPAASLLSNEVLLLMLVVMLGLVLGRLRVLGVQLGAAGVLFAGLGLSALFSSAPLHLAPSIKELGLVLFVYCVGLGSAAGFFRAFRDRGARWNAFVTMALGLGALLSVSLGRLLGLDRGQITGVFCGALTNTPALAAATDRLKGTALAQHPALGYSAAYPFGVLGALLLFRGFARRGRVDEGRRATPSQPAPNTLEQRNFEVTNQAVIGRALEELDVLASVGVVISRILRAGAHTFVPVRSTRLEHGDIVVAVGEPAALERALGFFGARTDRHVEAERTHVDMRRILVSRRELVGRPLGELDLETRFNAQVTRLRRADVDVLPSPELRLELGDRLRVVAPATNLPALGRFFGDSVRALAEIDFIALALGLSVGLVLAQVPLWPGSALKLGIAGPLLVSLLLGRTVRSGSLVWVLPYETNSVLRQFGLLMFLAGVGISSGSQLREILGAEGLMLVALGIVVTLSTNGILLGMMRWFGHASAAETLGSCSGAQTQPATLEAAYELSGRSESTYVAYAVVYPAAMIVKIVLAQIIALLG